MIFLISYVAAKQVMIIFVSHACKIGDLTGMHLKFQVYFVTYVLIDFNKMLQLNSMQVVWSSFLYRISGRGKYIGMEMWLFVTNWSFINGREYSKVPRLRLVVFYFIVIGVI